MMPLKSIRFTSTTLLALFTVRTSALWTTSTRCNSPIQAAGLLSSTPCTTFASRTHRRHRIVGELAISPMDKFMRSLEDMMAPQKPQEDGGEDQILTETSFKGEQRQESQNLDVFRRGLIKQTRRDNVKQQQSFTGYDMYDLIVEKFDVPYDVQINKAVFGGKPVLSFNIMWKYLGQSSFHLSEQEYLEHLEALAQLLKEWDRVDHFKKVLAETKKKPNAYFGYAVALPLDLAPDTLAGYFDGSHF